MESIKDEFNLNEGPAYEYKKHSKKIEKSLKDLQKNYLDFYEVLRKKGLILFIRIHLEVISWHIHQIYF